MKANPEPANNMAKERTSRATTAPVTPGPSKKTAVAAAAPPAASTASDAVDHAFVGARVVALHDQHSLPGRRLKLVKEAERSVWVSTYSYSDGDLTQELIAAADRGRKVSLLLHEQPKTELSRKNDGIHAKFAAKKGPGANHVVVSRIAVHAKCIVVDERKVLIGSQNCSLGKKPEFTLEFDDEGLGRALVAKLAELAQRGSSLVTARERKRERNRAKYARKTAESAMGRPTK